MNKSFEMEVLERLAKIEQKLDDYKSFKDKAVNADKRSIHNENRIDKIESNQKWIVLLVLGFVIESVIKLVIG